MWLCDVFGLSSTSRSAIESAFDPVVSAGNRSRSSVSRQFSSSPRRQAGGAPAQRTGLPAHWVQRGIVPISGVKVP
ncbi:hypothetical protein MUG10_02215 [Xanthomonas prunicola]|uniref:Uncharacterized protein n=1 Tax=Xanthomonas prunicola TaxID=2053930 RepID=A0A9Q9MS70_9XANT|nr:hypothetical protein [Xanthomonas prunicola]USJ01085.1 hypothetical protein MUG10_02215 [Xanthomonas prunicola]UXA49608.1 hypothetical protein M0D44_03290 [Xanthomonas prunicola]UXA55374.1 hypothetical protein M0D45_18985 [Xanthomonas prunicola]UXA57904.1 hypothetical protein M0D47_03275 [Xanthomonas prunicola]UXA60056.1 hypothetical protein M0D48_13570 [Xanthomonas prunicola]